MLCYVFSNRNTALAPLAPLAQEMRGLQAAFGLLGLTLLVLFTFKRYLKMIQGADKLSIRRKMKIAKNKILKLKGYFVV